MSSINAQETAQALIATELESVETLADYDRDQIAGTVDVPEVVGWHEAREVLNRYESEYGEEAEDLCRDKKYTASEWQEAQACYAQGVWYCAVQAEVSGALDTLETAIEEFKEEVELLGGDPDDAKFSTDCAYGWEPHNYETREGVMAWGARNPHSTFNYNPTLLEGELYAVSHALPGGVWLNLAWTPEAKG